MFDKAKVVMFLVLAFSCGAVFMLGFIVLSFFSGLFI